MGKNRNIQSLIKLLVNTIVHEIVLKHTNKPESTHFLNSEAIEYRSQTEKAAKEYNWNDEDKKDIKEKSIVKIKEKLNEKYADINYSEKEIIDNLNELMNQVI